MIAFPGQSASVIYTVESSGALTAAASGPTYTLYQNGSVVDTTSGTPTVTLTTTTITTGVYRVSFTVPGTGFLSNDVLELFAATGSTGSAVVGRWVILPDSVRTLPSFPSNFAALGINSSGHVSRVTLVDTTTTNTDMRGTDNAASQSSVNTLTGYVDTEVAAIKAKTDNLPSQPAAVGSAMTLTSAYDAAKTAASQTSVSAIATILSGITYLKNWLAVAMGKTADPTTLAEVNATTAGATYSNLTDSLEAVRDRGDSNWAGSGSGMTGAYAVTITVTDGTSPVPGALVRLKAGAAEDIKKTNGSGVAVFSVDDNTYSVRITADGLTFTPESLVVTGDTSQTYEMTEVIVDDTVWATGDDLVAYADASTIGQMLRDDNQKVASVDVPTHPVVSRMLMLGTSEVNSALQVSKRYTIDQMAAMSDVGREHLKWLTCSIALWHLRQRRINSDPDKQALDRKIITDHLDRLRRGETVLGIEAAQDAGIGEAVTFTQADQQRGTPLLRDRMSGTQGVFPSRRFNPRSGQ